MAWYKTGTIAVTNGSPTVTGTGTSWIANAAAGEAIYAPDGKFYEIASVNSDTSITLAANYSGTSLSGQTYTILPSQSFIRDLAAQAAALVQSYATFLSTVGEGLFDDGTISAPGISFVGDTNTGIRRTADGTFRLVSNGTDIAEIGAAGLTPLTALILPGATSPAQTAEGSMVWDTDGDLLTVGTGTSRKTMADTDTAQALTNKDVTGPTLTASTEFRGTKLTSNAASAVDVATSGGVGFKVAHAASVVNYLQVLGGATGASVDASTQGSDANVSGKVIAKGSGTIQLFGYAGSVEMFRFSNTASGVNYLQSVNSATGLGPDIRGAGSDVNVALNLVTKGTGAVNFYTNTGTQQFKVSHTASAVNYLEITGGAASDLPRIVVQGSDTNPSAYFMLKGTGALRVVASNGANSLMVPALSTNANYALIAGWPTGGYARYSADGSDAVVPVLLSSKSTGNVDIWTASGGALQFRATHTASAVNYMQVTGGATGNWPAINYTGSDATVGVMHYAKGASSHNFVTNNSVTQFQVAHTASAVNYLQATGGATGNGTTLSSQGSDANIKLILAGKGTSPVESSSNFNVASGKVYQVNGTQVLAARDTGWGAMTGTSNKATAYDTATVTLAQLAGRVMALQAALTTHGAIGA